MSKSSGRTSSHLRRGVLPFTDRHGVYFSEGASMYIWQKKVWLLAMSAEFLPSVKAWAEGLGAAFPQAHVGVDRGGAARGRA